MPRTAHSKTLTILVLVALQLALLPTSVRLGCLLRAGPSCCRVATTVGRADASVAPSCCSVAGLDAVRPGSPVLEGAEPEPSDGVDKPCTCRDHRPEPPGLSSPDRENHEAPSAPAERADVRLRLTAAAKRVALRPIPRARTGPPLHVLHQVFLI